MALVLAASGSGKTTWIHSESNIDRLFEDADIVCGDLHYCEFEQENHTEEHRIEHYRKIEEKLIRLKKDGRVILGCLFWDLVPDAIVIIPEEQHKKQVEKRRDLNWKSVCEINTFLINHAKEHDVPVFSDFDSCAEYIRSKL